MKRAATRRKGQKNVRRAHNRYGQRGVQLIRDPTRSYVPDPDATLEDVYGDDVPEVFRKSTTA